MLCLCSDLDLAFPKFSYDVHLELAALLLHLPGDSLLSVFCIPSVLAQLVSLQPGVQHEDGQLS